MSDASTPRPVLDPDRFLDLPFPLRVEVVGSAPSTNALVAARAKAGEEAGLVIVTEHQTAGRGRLDRVWETPARAALTFSVLLRPEIAPASWPWIPLLVGYAVQGSLADRVPEVALKWPNDVLVEDRKIAGILVERVETPQGPAAVVGVGINVNQRLDELPVANATSLCAELDETFDRSDLLVQVLGTLHALEPLLADPDALRPAYVDVCATLGREVDVHLPGGRVVRGEALDLDPSGALVVASAEGTLSVSAGDVVHVRAVG